jgi:hypothetical protein
MTRIVVLLAALGFSLGGCASTKEPVAENGLDRVKMAAVERAAARVGVGVHWVNPPQKPAR